MRTRSALGAVCVGVLLLAAAGDDAGARGRHGARARFEQAGDAAADGRHAADGRARLRVRDDGARLDCRFRRLDPAGDYALECDVPGTDPVPFTTDRRGRAKLRGIPLEAGSATDSIHLVVRADSGDLVLETDVHHPAHDDRHGGSDAPHDDGHHHDDADVSHEHDGSDGGDGSHDPGHHGDGSDGAPSDHSDGHHGGDSADH